ncbi:MAG: hypothetical protein ACTSYI_11695, partial [Promethearchaeota archaeon]
MDATEMKFFKNSLSGKKLITIVGILLVIGLPVEMTGCILYMNSQTDNLNDEMDYLSSVACGNLMKSMDIETLLGENIIAIHKVTSYDIAIQKITEEGTYSYYGNSSFFEADAQEIFFGISIVGFGLPDGDWTMAVCP